MCSYGTAVVAALTAQNTQTVTGISPVPPAFVAEQIDTLFADVRIDAGKRGMLGQQAVTRVVAERLAHWTPAHLVLDPGMVAKGGDRIRERCAREELGTRLWRRATLLKPNMTEAGGRIAEKPPESPNKRLRYDEKIR